MKLIGLIIGFSLAVTIVYLIDKQIDAYKVAVLAYLANILANQNYK